MDDNFKIESEIYKNFKPFLYQAISQINKEFRESTLDIIFESYNIPRTIINDCKIVIGGGDSYEFYINTDKDSRSKVRFQTNDCDCRFITEGDTLRVLKELKKNRDSNSVMYKSDTNIEIYIKNLKEYAADRITNYLNLNISEPFITKVNDRIKQKYPSFSFVRDFNGKLFNKSGFSDKLLSSINYNYEYNFSRRPEALMDLFPYIPEPTNKFIPHFRPSDNDIMIDENMIGKLLDNNDLVYNGFIRYMASNEDRTIKEIQEDLYIFGLGYLVWDIVRMINWSLKNYDRTNDRRNLNNKLDKYLKKYYDLIEAINNPEFYINCYSWKEFIRKCKNN